MTSPAIHFAAILGIAPGHSTLSNVKEKWGDAKTAEASDGGLWFVFAELGIFLRIAAADRQEPDPVIDEVHLSQPCAHKLPCGIHLGQPKSEALAIVRGDYAISDEFEDSIYFFPTPKRDLIASIEFKDSNYVTGIELFKK